MELTNLYVKSEYSFLSSLCRIEDIVKQSVNNGFKAIAITDENNMYGTYEFYKACVSNKIKPIIGLSLSYLFKDKVTNILLYAKNEEGYINLIRLNSIYNIYGKVSIEEFKKYGFGLIGIIPASDSIIYNDLLNNETLSDGLMHIEFLSKVLDKVYFGISKSNQFEYSTYHQMVTLLTYHHINMVGIVRTLMMSMYDNDGYHVLKSIKENNEYVDERLNCYFHSKDALVGEFKEYPFLLNNINEIIKECNVSISNKKRYPNFYQKVDTRQFLFELAHKGLEKRLLNTNKNIEFYNKRLNYELSVINKMGFNDYFLIVYDIIKFAKKSEIIVGVGRGSAVGSLVAYSIGIIDIDPLEYDLLFERFMNSERISMPDIDIDIEDERREEVINYVWKKYGENKVAHISAISTYGTKVALTDVANKLNLAEVRRKQIVKYIDKYNKGNDKLTLREIYIKDNDFKDFVDSYDDINRVVQIVILLEGLPKNKTTHASGIIITPDKLSSLVPVEKTSGELFQTQYSGTNLEEMGLLKIDFLGLRHLTNVKNIIASVKKDYKNFKLPTKFDDFKTFELLKRGSTKGLFQLDNEGFTKFIRRFQINNFNELIQAIALYRPGTIDLLDEFILRKFNQKPITYIHDDLKPILSETYGMILYQEQIMMISRKFAGYTLQKADLLRRAIAKKKTEEMEKIHADFVINTTHNGYTEQVAEEIFSYIERFANYGFNKSHSVAYAYNVYITAYLKSNFPAYFISNNMNESLGEADTVNAYFKEANKSNIVILPPHIEVSSTYFKTNQNTILMPLSAIKGLGSEKIKKIIELRPFSSFEDLVVKLKDYLTIEDFERLVYSGSLDSFKISKKSMIKNLSSVIERAKYIHITSLKELKYEEDEYDFKTLANYEKKYLGLNIRYNIFNLLSKFYDNQYSFKISDLRVGRNLRTIGRVLSIKETKTKKSDLMAFGVMEDDLSNIEFVMFSETYNKFKDTIKAGEVYYFFGNVEEKESKDGLIIQFVVNDIKGI